MKKIKNFLQYLFYLYLKRSNKTIRSQLKNVTEIPIIIISYNQLESLRNLIDFFLLRNFSNIVIIDNCSTYEPLLKYFEEIKDQVHIEKQTTNKGYRVFFDSPHLIEKYATGYYFLTDPDIMPNSDLPIDFVRTFISELEKNFHTVTKVGFALDLEKIPDSYPIKNKVIDWEKKYWQNEVKENVFFADIDTTFALYKPQYPVHFKSVNFYKAIRFGGNYTSQHMGWFVDPENYTEEQRYYFTKAGNSASWKLDDKGELTGYKKDY